MKKSLLIIAVLLSFAACSQNTLEAPTPVSDASPTPWVAGTETALAALSPTPWVGGTETAMAASSATFTPWVAGTETALAAVSPTFTPWVSGTQTAVALSSQTPFTPDPLAPTPVVWPREFSHVLYGGKFYQTTFFLLLGGVNTEAWLSPDESLMRYAGEATYSLHSLTQEYKYFVWGRAPELSPVCQTYSVGTDASLDNTGFVAVVDGWNITKRAVTRLSTDVQPYQQAVVDWLAAEGLPSPEIDQLEIQRVDLEGDGVDEVFISATRYDGLERITKTGDHSVILMRKVQGNEVVTILIAGEVYRGAETATLLHHTYSIANFIDLNQDGVLEVVVDIRRWEGFGATVYQVEGQSVTQVLHAGCGL